MKKEFIKGRPEGEHIDYFKEYLDTFEKVVIKSPYISNLEKSDLENSVTGFYLRKGRLNRDSPLMSFYDFYLFFDKSEKALDISPVNFIKIHLLPENYGFSDNKKVKISPVEVKLDCSEKVIKVYDKILNSNEINLNDLLEQVGFIVNDSMEYDFEKIMRIRRNNQFNEQTNIEYEKILRSKNYKPTGNEVRKGICSDAGEDIRKILKNLSLEKNLAFFNVAAGMPSFLHDTTLVFDKNTGEWAVINSKSPVKPYNLVPKKKLTEIGEPYSK